MKNFYNNSQWREEKIKTNIISSSFLDSYILYLYHELKHNESTNISVEK